MPAILARVGDELQLDLSGLRGASFQDALAKIREIPGRKFDYDTKLWLLPAEVAVADRVIHSIEPQISDELREWVKVGRVQAAQELTTPLPDDADLEVPWATKRAPWQPETIKIADEEVPFTGLMKHQRPLVDVAADRRKLIVGDDMGLGKTGAAISAFEEWRIRHAAKLGVPKPEGPKLIVCPTSVQGAWRQQIQMWLGEDEPYVIVNGTTAKARERQLVEGIEADAWVIVNWEQLRTTKVKRKIKRRNGAVSTKTEEVMKQPLFQKTPWLLVVADECHRAKNRKAQLTRGLFRTRSEDGLMIAMSGTPLLNDPAEIWSALHWLWPKEYTSYWRFYESYVEYDEGHFGKVITGVKNPDALRFELKDRLVRRTQGEVLDLPGKVRIPVPLTLNPKQRKLYDEAVVQMWVEIEQAYAEGDPAAQKLAEAGAKGASLSDILRLPNGAARTVRLRQIMESPALLGGEDDSAVLDACVDKIMDSRPEPWIVFTEFADTPGLLVKRLAKHNLVAVEYTGRVDPAERSKIQDRFQAGEIDVIVGTIKSMYQGITLTAGNKQYWCSRDWTPAINEQGEDRQNRIGQTDRVFVYIAQPEATVATQRIEPLNRLKERIVGAVIPSDPIDHEHSNG